MADVAYPDRGLADPDRVLAVDDDARGAALAAVQIGAVDASHVFGGKLARLVAKHAQMVGSDIGIVDNDIVVVAAADACFSSRDPESRRDVALARQDFDPDHLTTCSASRKRLPRPMASS